MTKKNIVLVMLLFANYLAYSQEFCVTAYDTAKVYFEKGDYESAKANFEDALSCKKLPAPKDEIEGWKTKCNACITLKKGGDNAFAANNYKKAQSFFEELLIINPKDADCEKKLKICNDKMQTMKKEEEKITISGTVKNERSYTISGVRVKLKGTTDSVTTDNEGKYSIKASGDKNILIFSYEGMQTDEEKVKGTNLDFTMKLIPKPRKFPYYLAYYGGLGYTIFGVKVSSADEKYNASFKTNLIENMCLDIDAITYTLDDLKLKTSLTAFKIKPSIKVFKNFDVTNVGYYKINDVINVGAGFDYRYFSSGDIKNTGFGADLSIELNNQVFKGRLSSDIRYTFGKSISVVKITTLYHFDNDKYRFGIGFEKYDNYNDINLNLGVLLK